MREKWLQAIEKERQWHFNRNATDEYVKTKINNYFKLLQIQQNLRGKSILEIGCALHPALQFCTNYSKSYIIEPMWSEKLVNIAKLMKVQLIFKTAEETTFPKVDEVWFFNVLTHTYNPDLIISKSVEAASTIRFFEPIETNTDDQQLYSFSQEYFVKHFGDIVNYYAPNPQSQTFHKHQAAYGVYEKNNPENLRK